MSHSADQTARWNGVPPGAIGRTKARRCPAKYSANCSITSRNGVASGSPNAALRRTVALLVHVQSDERPVDGDEGERADRAVHDGVDPPTGLVLVHPGTPLLVWCRLLVWYRLIGWSRVAQRYCTA